MTSNNGEQKKTPIVASGIAARFSPSGACELIRVSPTGAESTSDRISKEYVVQTFKDSKGREWKVLETLYNPEYATWFYKSKLRALAMKPFDPRTVFTSWMMYRLVPSKKPTESITIYVCFQPSAVYLSLVSSIGGMKNSTLVDFQKEKMQESLIETLGSIVGTEIKALKQLELITPKDSEVLHRIVPSA